MFGFIQQLFNHPDVALLVVIICCAFYYLGVLIAWLFQGGIFRKLIGAYLTYGIFTILIENMPFVVKVALFSGFLMRYLGGKRGLINLKDRIVWGIEDIANSRLVRSIRRKITEKKQPNTEYSQQSNQKSADNHQQAEYEKAREKERARRAEEMHRQREAEKARQQAEAEKDEHTKHSGYQQEAGSEETHDNTSESNEGVDDFFQDMVRKMHLATLGLNPMGEHSQADIKKAYQRQAKKYHPDRHQDKSIEEIKEMEARFTEAKRAYEWLKNNA